MTINKRSPPGASAQHDYDALIPDELLAASHRRAASRVRASTTLHRSKIRRRVLPTIVVTSVAVFGAGLANAFVGSTIPVVTTTTTTTVPLYVARQNALNAKTLAKLTATLALDRRVVSALTATAANTSAAAASIATRPTISSAGATTAPTPAASTASSGTSSASTSSTVPASTAVRSATPAPTTATTAPTPTPIAAPPPTHATTGASGAG